jgi:hypothetical protein
MDADPTPPLVSKKKRPGTAGEHRVARLRQRRKRTPGQPVQLQDADFLATVAAAATTDFIPSTASNFINCATSLCRMGQLGGQTSSLTSHRSQCRILVIRVFGSAISSTVCLYCTASMFFIL